MAAVAAALAILGLAACSNHGGTAQSLPHARSYQTLRALWRASATAGGPRSQPHVIHAPFSKTGALGRLLPTASQYGAVLVATPGGGFALKDGTPAANVLCALFPGRAPRAECDAFAGWFYGGAGWHTVVQLVGPNWVLWGIPPDRRTFLAIRSAIGGQLSQPPVATASPE